MNLFLALALIVWGTVPLRAEPEDYEAKPGLINVGWLVLFYNSKGPLSYDTPTRSELPADAVPLGPVECNSCQRGLSIPLPISAFGRSRAGSLSGALGDGGFERALANLRKTRPDLRGIYDVKVDMRRVSVLGIYKKMCMEISAQGFR